MSVTIGTWGIPALITVAAFALAIWKTPSGGGSYYDFSPLVGCVYLPLAGCASLIAWLIWALAA